MSPGRSPGAEGTAGQAALAHEWRFLYLAGLASFLGPASVSIYTPSLVALRATFDTTNALAGATVSTFGLVLAVSQLLYGPLVDRFSGKAVLAGGLGLYVVASLLGAWAPSIGVFLLARSLQAIGVAAGLVVGGALVSDRFPPARRAAAMGTLQMFNALGASTGPLVGSAVIALGLVWQVDFLVLAGLGTLAAGGVLTLLPPLRAPSERFTARSIAQVLAQPATLAVALLGAAQYCAHFSLLTFAPAVLSTTAHLEPQWTGLLLLPQTLGVSFGAPVLGRLSDRWGRRRVALAGIAGSALALGSYTLVLLLVAGPGAVLWLVLAQGLFGLSLGASAATQLVLMVEWWPQQRGAAVGTYAAVRYAGAALGPLGGGWLLDRFALWAPFAAVTALLLATGLVALRLVREPATP
ncbi:MAG TPA: MFS transporter [Chloroflexota bacterium]|nr:MFS transporter [Chloroflexota bacterium]